MREWGLARKADAVLRGFPRPSPYSLLNPCGETSSIDHASSTPLIEARDLTKRFGGIIAVSNLNLAVHHGELVGLIGPNGSGKTTTINLLTGHLAQASGHIFLRGQQADGRSRANSPHCASAAPSRSPSFSAA